MKSNERRLMRQAVLIHQQRGSKHFPHIDLPAASWQQCLTLHRRMYRARQQGWWLAFERLRCELKESLRLFGVELTTIDRLLEPECESLSCASVADIYADLVAMHEEFSEVHFDRSERTISVTTEPIELEGVYLGAFKIRLHWSNLVKGHLHGYRVLAIDANPAASNDSVTHPHVQDEAVCEGDGHQPIRNALKQGRLLDFFVIVANLLRTYNSESPYVSLADWYGQECTDCGATVSDDQRWTCEKCENSICDECHYNCPDCDGIFCNECVMQCEGCDETHCLACMKQCAQCDSDLCVSCLEINKRCTDCHDQETEEEADQPVGAEETSEGCAVTPLHANRVGETAVST